MTTILLTDVGMAADSLVDDGGVRVYEEKIFCSSRYAIAVAGNFVLGKRFVRWMNDKRLSRLKKEIMISAEAHGGFDAIVVDVASHTMQLWDEEFDPETIEPPYAIGSGREAALGAYYALMQRLEDQPPTVSAKIEGETHLVDPYKTAKLVALKDSVEAACKVDCGSGGDVDCYLFRWQFWDL